MKVEDDVLASAWEFNIDMKEAVRIYIELYSKHLVGRVGFFVGLREALEKRSGVGKKIGIEVYFICFAVTAREFFGELTSSKKLYEGVLDMEIYP